MSNNAPDTPNIPFPTVARDQSYIRQFVNGPLENFLDIFNNRYNDIYCNGFEVVVDNSYDVIGTGAPAVDNRAIQYLHQTLCNFCTATPPSSKWAVFIEPENSEYLYNELLDMRKYEPWSDSKDWYFPVTAPQLTNEQHQTRIGCIFAMGAAEAGVSIGVQKFGGTGGAINGFTKSSSTQGRVDNDQLDLVFRETNCSYVDFVLRPWISLTGHKGFHARPQSESIKSTITIFEMAGVYPNKRPIIRKIFKYYGCNPINLGTESLTYEPNTLIQKVVSFDYKYYTVQDGSGLNLNSDGGDSSNSTDNLIDTPEEPTVFEEVIPDK